MKKLILLVVLLPVLVYGQELKTTKKIDDPISDNAYNRKLLKDLNLIILGDNSVSEGFTYKLNDDKSELELSGKFSFKRFPVVVAKGKYAMDNGNYIFNDKDGAKKAEVSLSSFWLFPGNSNKYGEKSHTNRRILLSIAEEREKWNEIERLKDSISYYEFIMEVIKIPTKTKESPESIKTYSELNKNKDGILWANKLGNTEIKDVELQKILKKYLPDGDVLLTKKASEFEKITLDDKVLIGKYTEIFYEYKESEEEKKKAGYKKKQGFVVGYLIDKLNTKKLIADYEKLLERKKNNKDNLADAEIKAAQEIWTKRKLYFYGLSATYTRESFNAFVPIQNFESFSDLFDEKLGDLYEFGGNINALWQWKKAFVFVKGFGSIGRQSNFSDFKQSTINYNVPTGITDVDGNPVIQERSKTIYSNSTEEYKYTFAHSVGAEVYGGHNNIGLYSRIEYKEGRRDGDFLTKSFPWEFGIYASVKSSKKDLFTLLLFVRRSDLFINPDDDMKMGFKIGLPFQFNKNL